MYDFMILMLTQSYKSICYVDPKIIVKKIIGTRNMQQPQHEENIFDLRNLPEELRLILGRKLFENDNRNVAMTSVFEADRRRNLEIQEKFCAKELDISPLTIQSPNLRTNPIFRNQNFNPGPNQNLVAQNFNNYDLMKAYVRAILLAAINPIEPPTRLTFSMNHINFSNLIANFSEALICVLKNIQLVTILPFNDEMHTMHMNDIVWIIRIINENIHPTTLDVSSLGTHIGSNLIETPSLNSLNFPCKITVICHPNSIFQQWLNIPYP